MAADWERAKAKAHEIRRKYVTSSAPANAFTIARKEGIQIIYFRAAEKTYKIAGLFSRDERTIYLNADDTLVRQNFTLAHELAHYFLAHNPDEYGVSWRHVEYADVKPEKEQEADCFAAELLMPAHLITEAQKTYDLDSRQPSALARLFGVSTSAMKYRLRSLKRAEQA